MAGTYLLGPFRLDAETDTLFRGGEPVSLGRRAVALLRVLVEQRGIPVSKDALVEAAWAGLTVEESNLTVQIAALRRVLGEEPGGENWIETLPRRGYRFIGPASIRDQGAVTAASQATNFPMAAGSSNSTVPDRLSIAVLPFANISGDPEQEYFVDGVTESLTTDLSRISGAFVIARNTAFTFKGKAVDVKRLGRELNVRYVLEGSVQRGGNRLRVNVQLVDAETGNHLWAERFDKPVADLFDMQDEIVSRLANTLDAQLIAAEARRAERSLHPDAMDLVFQGRAWFNKGLIPDYIVQARRFFEKAIALDPQNVEAMVGLARVDAVLGTAVMTDDWSARFASAEASLTKALSLAPNHALAHGLLGLVQMFTKRAVQGIAECEQALALDCNFAPAHALIGLAKYLLGRGAETEPHINEALRLSPRDTIASQWLVWIGLAKTQLGADAEAVIWMRRGLDANRNYSIAHFVLAAMLARLGELDEARAAVQVGLALDPNFTIRRYRDATNARSNNPTFLAGRERHIEGMRLAGVPEG
jgi:TolB-like protein/Flp pilus assembly protein TadD